MRVPFLPILGLICLSACARAEQPPATQPQHKLQYLDVDVKAKKVRVECAGLRPDMPLEFFCVVAGTNEHESALRSPVKPSDLHLALLMIGLKPGEPVHWSEAKQTWLPPHGPPLQIFCEFEREGKKVSVPAYRLMRDVKSKKEMPPMTWIFAGSRIMPDGKYAADVTGYLVSVVNFDLTVIDIPQLASNANETLQWEVNPDVAPETGAKVTMVIEPTGEGDSPATKPVAANFAVDEKVVKIAADGKITLDAQPVTVDALTEALTQLKAHRPMKVVIAPDVAADTSIIQKVVDAAKAANVPVEQRSVSSSPDGGVAPGTISNVATDRALMNRLKQRWNAAVSPHAKELREAAQAHYEVIGTMRREQQRLIDEADRIQRAIDELEKQYQEMTTPSPEPATQP